MTAGKVKFIEKTQKSPEPSSRTLASARQSGSTVFQGAFDVAMAPQMAGNLAVQQLFRAGAIQAKLAISQPGDPDEEEADRVADQVMRMAKPTPISSSPGTIQRKCAACEAGGATCPKCEEEEKLQRKEKPGHAPQTTPAIHSQIAALRGGGQPLPPSVRAFFEPRFGADFSQVRVHTDAAAQQSAQDVNANAYTAGQNIVFGTGRFAPETQEGRRLLAHELTHVVQQSAHSLQGIVQRQRRGAAAGCGICMNDPGGRLAGRIAHCEVQEAFAAANPDIIAERPVPIPGMPSMPTIPVPCLQRPVPPVPTVDLSYETSEHGQTVIYLGEIKPLDDDGVQGPLGRAQLQDYAREFVLSGQYDDRVYRMQDSPPLGPLFFENPMNPPGCRQQMIIVQLTEPGLYQYYCEPPFSELVRDPNCCCPEEEPDEEEEQKDKEPEDKEQGPSESLPEQLLQLGGELLPILAAAGLLDIGLAIAGVLGAFVSSPLVALAAVVLGIAFFWDKLEWLSSKIAGMAQWVWDKIAGLAYWVRGKFTWILGKLHELGIKLAELGSWLAGKIAWLAGKFAEGLTWIAGKIAAGGRWLGRKIASAAEAIWDWLWGSDIEPTVPTIEMPVIEEPTQHCATVAHEDTIVKLDIDLLFPFDEWELKEEADDPLGKAAAKIVLLLQKDDRIIIEGYTDNIGSDEYNQRLSEQRAGAVASWFVERGVVPMSRIQIKGYGKTRAQYNDPEGRKKDRRVEIWVPKHGSVEKVCW
jgi:outer membrane protein OmpA-like peptidoglycan-associated protein